MLRSVSAYCDSTIYVTIPAHGVGGLHLLTDSSIGLMARIVCIGIPPKNQRLWSAFSPSAFGPVGIRPADAVGIEPGRHSDRLPYDTRRPLNLTQLRQNERKQTGRAAVSDSETLVEAINNVNCTICV